MTRGEVPLGAATASGNGTASSAGVRVKICGLTRREDAEAAAGLGADYLGAVLVPASPRAVDPSTAGHIAAGLGVPLALVTADLGTAALVAAARTAEARVLQLHGAEGPAEISELRGAGDWTVWKAVRVRELDDLTEAIDRYAGRVHALLLDAWHPERLGGTGVPFGWEEVAGALESRPAGLEVVVAGGLVPENVREAIRVLCPDVVDVSSGVEAEPGIKDVERMQAFIEAARTGRS